MPSGPSSGTLQVQPMLHVEQFHIRNFCADQFDSYIIVSFLDATLVLSIGETVEEVTDSGFNGKTRTLSASRLGDDAFVQVDRINHPSTSARLPLDRFTPMEFVISLRTSA